jgi:hypothetical protein
MKRLNFAATYHNNIAVGLVIGGVFIPYFAFVQRMDEFATWLLDSLRDGKASISLAVALKIFFNVFAGGLAVWASKIFRRAAREGIAKVKD